MTLKHLFYLQSTIVFMALFWMLAPAMALDVNGTPGRDAASLLFAQNTGVLHLGYGVVAFVAARAPDSPLRRDIRLAFFILHTVMVVVHTLAWLTTGVALGNGFALAVHLTLAIAFGYFQFVRPEERGTAPQAAV